MIKRIRKRLSALIGHRESHYLGRYSVEQFCLFDNYQRTTSSFRVVAITLLTPIPTFLALMAMDIVPMNSPEAGPAQNAVAFTRSTISHAVMTFFALLPFKQALNLSNREYSFTKIAVIACCTSLTVEGLCISLAFTWRFPVPLREFIGLPLWMASVCGYNIVFAKRAIRRLWRRKKLQLYLPIAGVQVTLFYLLLGLSVGFLYLPPILQAIAVLSFPVLKITLKRTLWKYAHRLDNIATDVTICMVEVSGALYQTVCMQFVTSPVLSVLVMVTDMLQAIHEVRTHSKLDYIGDGRNTLQTVQKIVETSMTNLSTRKRRSSRSIGRAISGSRESRNNFANCEMNVSTESNPNRFASVSKHQRQGRSVVIPRSAIRQTGMVKRQKSRRHLLDLDRATQTNTHDRDEPSVRYSSEYEPSLHRLTKKLRTHSLAQRSDVASRLSIVEKCLSMLLGTSFSRRRWKVYVADDHNATANEPVKQKMGNPSPEKLPTPPESFRDNTDSIQHEARKRKASLVQIDGILIAHRHHARILEQTLQLLFACEVLLFAEYMEVVIPALYALTLGGEWLTPNAKYNIVVSPMSGAAVASQIANALLYALLELASMLAMYWVMKRKYGVSAFYQLAFVLERYWMTLQGKLVGAFIVVMNALTIHQGAAFFSERKI